LAQGGIVTFGVLLLHAVSFSSSFGRVLLGVTTYLNQQTHYFSMRWFHDHVTHPFYFFLAWH
jgi:hypothetical protein